MLKVTSRLEEGNYLNLPEPLCRSWNIEADATLHAYAEAHKLKLAKRQRPGAFALKVFSGPGILLPEFLVGAMRFRVGSEIPLVLADDIVTLGKGARISLSLPQEELLKLKLQHELDEYRSREYAPILTLKESICMYITLSVWTKEEVEWMLEQPELLKNLAWKFLRDEAYQAFFEQKIEALVSACKARTPSN